MHNKTGITNLDRSAHPPMLNDVLCEIRSLIRSLTFSGCGAKKWFYALSMTNFCISYTVKIVLLRPTDYSFNCILKQQN